MPDAHLQEAQPTTGSHSIDRVISDVLTKADVVINGPRPWDIQIHHPDTVSRVARQRSLGLGESYMDGWWDCEALDEFCFRILKAGAEGIAKNQLTLTLQWLTFLFHNRQSAQRAPQVARQHYDLGNQLFELMLGRTMAYSCGYWHEAQTLDQAQDAKLDLVCRKLGLEPGMTLLDIGCGWGSLLEHAAKHYGVSGTGVTLSEEQVEGARVRCQGLPVKILLEDYRELSGRYDCVASIGMFEHVGRRNYTTFMETTAHLLRDDGLMLLHCIGENKSTAEHDPWIEKYIFPNGELPSIKQIAEAAEDRFVVEDMHNFGPDYARTLTAWDANFRRHWGTLKTPYDERFYRMWRYYLNLCAGAFRARNTQLWQWVFSKPSQRNTSYRAPR
ncbi:MAG: cyclopropane fatty acyl phospholipid synthase [Marinobacter sp.]|uniref:cyclopropane fatty acyl phospholipid synthase n=1 Tax=Marinobacter sp. TaxID=50741 RepID=UPI003F9970BA